MVKTKIRKLINPHRPQPPKKATPRKRKPVARKTSSGSRRKPAAQKKNPSLITLGFLNPNRRKAVAETKKKSNGKASRRPNPFVFFGRKGHSSKAQNPRRGVRRKRNPESVSVVGGTVGMVKFGLWALLGLLVTRQVPQVALGARNTSWLGYGSNAATALAAMFAARKAVGKEAAQAIGIGGMLYTIERILREQFNPISQALSLSGCGDHSAALGGVNVRERYSPMPVRHDRAGNPIIPREIDAAAAVAAAQAKTAPSRVSGVSRVSAIR
jgi:hypothetical protein